MLPALALCACAISSYVSPGDLPAGPPVILQGDQAARLLRPCTRPQPAPGDSLWIPDTASVNALEARLASYIIQASRARPGHGPTKPLDWYRGQYAGFVS